MVPMSCHLAVMMGGRSSSLVRVQTRATFCEDDVVLAAANVRYYLSCGANRSNMRGILQVNVYLFYQY